MKAIIRSYDEKSNIIREYIGNYEVKVEYEDDIINQVDYYILQALLDTNQDANRVDVEDEDGHSWYPI